MELLSGTPVGEIDYSGLSRKEASSGKWDRTSESMGGTTDWSFPGSSDGKIICLQCWRPGFNPWVGKITWRRKQQPTQVPLPGKFHGWRNLVGYSHGVAKSQTQVSDFAFTFTFHKLARNAHILLGNWEESTH